MITVFEFGLGTLVPISIIVLNSNTYILLVLLHLYYSTKRCLTIKFFGGHVNQLILELVF